MSYKKFDYKRERCFHEFKKTKEYIMQNNFVFLDSETSETKISETEKVLKFKLACVIFWNRELNEIIKKTYTVLDNGIIRFWDDLEFRFDNDNKEVIWYAHNSGFDFKIMDGFRQLFLRGWYLRNHYIKNTTFILTFEKQVENGNKYVFRVWDTLNIVRKPLESLGESLGYPKLKIDFSKCNDKQLETYCKRDTLIIYKFIRKFIDFLLTNEYMNSNGLYKLCSTIGSLSFNIFRRCFYDPAIDGKIFIHNFKSAIRLEREAYRGGITDCFRIGTFENMIKTDINSMYPFVMKENEIPVKLVMCMTESHTSSAKLYQLYKDCRKLGLSCIAKVTIKLPKKFAYLLDRFNDKSSFAYGLMKISLAQPELDFLHRNKIKILAMHKFTAYETRNIFKEFVRFFYGLRKEYRKQDKEIYVEICKLILNNQYGKWAQRDLLYKRITKDDKFYKKNKDLLMLMFVKNKDIIKRDSMVYLGTIVNEAEVYIVNNELWIMKQTQENAYDSFVAISCFITSYARMLLVDYIMRAKRKNVYYCDTDSLFVNEKGYNRLQKAGCIDKYELGKLKNEHPKENGKYKVSIYAPKYYDLIDQDDLGIFENFLKKRKLKGIRKSSDLLSENNEQAKYKIETWKKFKADLRNGNYNEQLIIESEKVANKSYDKGKIGNDGFVQPFSMKEIESQIDV